MASVMENEQAALLGYFPWQVSHCPFAPCIHQRQDSHSIFIVRVVSFVLCGEAVAQVKISHVFVYVVATYDTHTNLHLSFIVRLSTCQSSSALIVRLDATLIYSSFEPQCNFMVSIIKCPPVLELFSGTPILEILLQMH